MKEEHHNHVDRLFQSHLKGFREKPPENAWERLDGSMAGYRRMKRVSRLQRIAAVILILLAFGSGYFLANLNRNNTPSVTGPVQNDQAVSAGEQEAMDRASDNNIEDDGATVAAVDPVQLDAVVDPDAGLPAEGSEKSSVSGQAENEEAQYSHVAQRQSQPINYMSIRTPKEVNMAEATPYKNLAINEYQNEILQVWPDDVSEFSHGREKTGSGQGWSVGAGFAPFYSYRDLSGTPGMNSGLPQDKEYFNQVEEGLLSFTGGVSVSYDLSRRVSVESGVFFSQTGMINNEPLYYKADGDGYQLLAVYSSAGDFDVERSDLAEEIVQIPFDKDSAAIGAMDDARLIQHFNYLDIPLMLRFKLIEGKIGFRITGGLIPSILVGNSVYL